MKWIIKIEKVDNGYKIDYPNEDIMVSEVVEIKEGKFDEERKDECIAMYELLWKIMNALGFNYSDHAKFNTVIKVVDSKDKKIEV